MQLYGHPILGRYGLGNMLFPWARCFLWCKDHQVPMLAPRWTYLRIGPYLRGERDKRNYQYLFHGKGYIREPRRAWIHLTGQVISEQAVAQISQAKPLPKMKTGIVQFQGMQNHFAALIGRHREVSAELQRITKPQHRPEQANTGNFIGIHVRRGDFVPVGREAELRQGRHDYQISLQWYIDALTEIRKTTGQQLSAKVFSDGTDDELAELLRLPNIERNTGGSAIKDILMLAQSKVMIASGSTFSMWASYLGQVPAIWYPGQRRQFILAAGCEAALEPEWEPGQILPEKFVQIAAQIA